MRDILFLIYKIGITIFIFMTITKLKFTEMELMFYLCQIKLFLLQIRLLEQFLYIRLNIQEIIFVILDHHKILRLLS